MEVYGGMKGRYGWAHKPFVIKYGGMAYGGGARVDSKVNIVRLTAVLA
jgi:hypothetical protein